MTAKYCGAMCEVPLSLWRHLTHQCSNNTIITKNPGGSTKKSGGSGGGGGEGQRGGKAMTIFGENDFFSFFGCYISGKRLFGYFFRAL
jgi:hypothetical protein